MILDLFKLDGKVAVVTGANTGLGQGMAVALAEAGAKVVGVGRRSCAETKEKIEAFGGSFTEVLADLSTTAAVDTVLSGALDAYGRVDILVNNAGIIKRCDAVDVTEADWDTVIDINERSSFLKPGICKAVYQAAGRRQDYQCGFHAFLSGWNPRAFLYGKQECHYGADKGACQ